MRVEETDDSFRLLERLDQPVEQRPVEAPVAESDAIFVVFVKGVHGETSRVVRYLELTAVNASVNFAVCQGRKGYQGRSPWLVSVHYRY
jgi:hypothetical protein